MIRLPMDIHTKLANARLAPFIDVILDECAAHGYLLHPTAILGSGTFGTVFLAAKEDETVAMKVSVPQPGLEGAFAAICEAEGRKACALAFIPQVAAGQAYWQAQGAPLFFLATRYIHGMNLSSYLERVPGSLDEARLIAWALQLTAGLAAMHQAGVVHRDLKPENILWEAASDKVYIADLGIAKYARSGTLLDLRRTGTHPYAPPEQVRGKTSPKSDQYALGVVLFELATRAAAAPSVAAPRLGYPVARLPRLAPRQYNPALGIAFCALIERLAALDPAERFASMHAAHEALLALRHEEAPAAVQPVKTEQAADVSREQPPPAVTSAPAEAATQQRPAFAWRPGWHLRQVFLGGPISLGGPALRNAGQLCLMALYYGWIVAGGLCAGFLWWAISGDERRMVWALAGTALVAVWFILRHWTILPVHRRGSLGEHARGLLLGALFLALASAGLLVRIILGQTAGTVSPVWLAVICSFLVWLCLYAGIEVWVN